MSSPVQTASPRFCIVIPVFQHVEPVAAVLSSLDNSGLPCVLVDDGNPIPISEALRVTLSTRPWTQVIRLPRNTGKGAASIAGFVWAAERGYSHTILLDADGQHDVLDLPKVLNLARANPNALLLGRPLFDKNAPWGRRWGRLLTCVWTWIETLSFDIGDSLFGFRCYPLAPVLKLTEKVSFGQRMSFDPEIAVRLYWAGVPVVNFVTNVRYPVKGISNFRLWQDNGALTLMHTRLFFGMLRRWWAGEILFGGHR